MIIRHYDVQSPETKPPDNDNWQPTWHGYWELKACETQNRKLALLAQDKTTHSRGMITEPEFEKDCLLSILSDIKHDQVNMFELGAGWGRMSLALAGAINHKIVPMIPSSYFCVAVEAEPTHYQWLKRNFEAQQIDGVAIHGAVSNKPGKTILGINSDPAEEYGQGAISPFSVGGIIYQLTKKTIRVPVYTIDQLVKKHLIQRLDIVDIDVQGFECKVIQGAKDSIKNWLIDYLMIGTHNKEYNLQLRELLSGSFELVIDIPPNTVFLEWFKPVKMNDGMQVYRRKSLA